MTVIYVGQQDWANIPADLIPLATTASATIPGDTANTANTAEAPVPVCSASLLSFEQGTTEAADAIAKLRADGFPAGTTVFLDIEGVTRITQPLLDYYRGWMTGVANDGRYRTGVYVSKGNAQTFHDTELRTNAGVRFTPTFWVAGSGNFSLTSAPADVGVPFADVWQGAFNVTQTFNGVTLQIDVNVSSSASPSAP